MPQEQGIADDADDSNKSLTNSLDTPPTSSPREYSDDLAQNIASKGSVAVLNNTLSVAASRVGQGNRKGSKKKGKLPSEKCGRGLGFSASEVKALLELLDAHQSLRKDD